MYLIQQNTYQQKDIKLFACFKNEERRIPFFLSYYRRLGVEHFFLVDNCSSDKSLDLIRNQTDITIYQTDEPYNQSNAGRLWTDYLRKKHGMSSWCLTVDFDEFFVYPFSEDIKLNDLVSYLDIENAKAVFSIMVDHYPKGKISKTKYISGESLFEKFPYFDKANNYTTYKGAHFPYIQVKGGVRQRKIWDKNDYKSGPSQKKIPFIFFDEKFEYYFSTHSCSEVRLANLTGVLAHFKFLDNFKSYTKMELDLGTRVNPEDYKKYNNFFEKNDILFNKIHSLKYANSTSYFFANFFTIPTSYISFIINNLNPNSALLEKLNNSRVGVSSKFITYDSFITAINLSLESFHQNSNKSQTLNYSQLNSFQQNFNKSKIRKINNLSNKYFYNYEKSYEELLVERILRFKSFRCTYFLRKILCKFNIFPKEILFEDNFLNKIGRSESQINAHLVFESIWWDLAIPIRMYGRFKRVLKKVISNVI